MKGEKVMFKCENCPYHYKGEGVKFVCCHFEGDFPAPCEEDDYEGEPYEDVLDDDWDDDWDEEDY